jgi:hypothetical protein
MRRRPLGTLTRNAEARLLLESFLVAAVASFLGIRGFLALTGYPQIGSNGIHIAHMLWGGLLMLLALMLLLAFIDRSVEHLAAVIAGLGFGTFIDEIGKFVTSDNNYFYRPAVALIYAVFVVGFLVGRTLIGQQRQLSPNEALANALDLLTVTLTGPIEPQDRLRIEELLELADPTAPLSRLAKGYLAELPEAATRDSRVARVQSRLADAYDRLMSKPWAESALIVGVAGYAAAMLGGSLVDLASSGGRAEQTSTFATTAEVASTIAGAACVGFGLIRLRSSRTAAFQWFIRGLLVWILVTQVFVFYSSQLTGIGGLIADLIAYGGVRFGLAREGAVERIRKSDIRAMRDEGGPRRSP